MIQVRYFDGVRKATINCDHCGLPVTSLHMGAALFLDGDVAQVTYVHKGNCHDQAQRSLGNVDSSWQELATHVRDILETTNASMPTVNDLVEELGMRQSWRGAAVETDLR